jgi:hypothetical protein
VPVQEAATRLKDVGNDHFKGGRFEEATSAYSQALESLLAADAPMTKDGTDAGPVRNERVTLLTNRATSRFKAGDVEGCIADCDEALGLDPVRVKALFRRAAVSVIPTVSCWFAVRCGVTDGIACSLSLGRGVGCMGGWAPSPL